MKEEDKFDEIAKKIILLNPSVKTTFVLVKMLIKHGLFKACMLEAKIPLTGQDEIEIEYGMKLQNLKFIQDKA